MSSNENWNLVSYRNQIPEDLLISTRGTLLRIHPERLAHHLGSVHLGVRDFSNGGTQSEIQGSVLLYNFTYNYSERTQPSSGMSEEEPPLEGTKRLTHR